MPASCASRTQACAGLNGGPGSAPPSPRSWLELTQRTAGARAGNTRFPAAAPRAAASSGHSIGHAARAAHSGSAGRLSAASGPPCSLLSAKAPGLWMTGGGSPAGREAPQPSTAPTPLAAPGDPPPSCSPGTRKQAPLTAVHLPGPWQHSAGPQEAREAPFEEGAPPHPTPPHPTPPHLWLLGWGRVTHQQR